MQMNLSRGMGKDEKELSGTGEEDGQIENFQCKPRAPAFLGPVI